ncbi:MAG: STAS/SEC14 domain-containing protein [Bacteroidota bacterium]|nr:STAS/SEC14 domain-containing protein [Bacteroidota bacterium]
MSRPTDKEIFEGEIAAYWIDEGILVSLSKSPKRTVENITQNLALVKTITNNKRTPLLIYLTNSPIPDKATRKFASEKVAEVYTAMAMVSKRGLASLIMNLLFKLKAPPIPMRNFADDKEAKDWLKQFL